ncbi:MAG: thioredoxin domain-containing protein [Dehalococcoidia bacterium]|nr:thioredoxin domain-containing protein [Dehalococcoidia bacterium]
MTTEQHNRLALEKSPYLLQHAGNPVDWYPWGDEAFAKAAREDKPIFLSIGYSTCHWCHVMAHESFEDARVGELMNETFVSIKVDREERPDIDMIYMAVCQMLTGSGGWPLTILMTPDKKPFYAATYIPKENAFGHVGMIELVPRIQQLWHSRRAEMLDTADKLATALRKATSGSPGETLGIEELHAAYTQLARNFDPQHGGFGKAPKFPTPHHMLFLLRYWKRTGDRQALSIVETTLQAMRLGGIFDQIGFGFHRYSTDQVWLVPHFEKMLYDQALLALAYLEAYQAAGSAIYADTAREIFQYVQRDMTSPEGGFFSAEDADSEGVEGKFYVWTAAQVRDILGATEGDLFCRALNVTASGNYAEEASGENTGANIFYQKGPFLDLASELGLDPLELARRLSTSRESLYRERAKRVHPSKDDKILTDWNGLMIAALAKGAQVLGEEQYATAAQRAVDFILEHLSKTDDRLLHRYRDGQADIPAYMNDYAYLIWGLLETYSANLNVHNLQVAVKLNSLVNKHFWDWKNGGYFLSADDAEILIVRQKESYDGAIPSGNAVQMLNLLRLGRITGDVNLETRAAELGRAFAENVRRSPIAYTHFLSAVDFALGPAQDLTIIGKAGAGSTSEMLRAAHGVFLPNLVLLFRPTDQPSPAIESIADFIKDQPPLGDETTAYVCIDHSCQAPTTDLREMLHLLGTAKESLT